MADKTWPFDDGDPRFAPEAFDESLEFDVEITTSRSGRVTTQALPGARWRLNMVWPDTTVAYLLERRQLEAFLVGLRGGADRLLIHNLLTPEPLGTMRGTVTLSATLAAGATSASVTGGRAGANLLTNSGFEIDSNADSVADGWTQYTSGSVGTVTAAMPSAAANTGTAGLCQRISSTALNGSIGVRRTADVSVTVGLPYTWSITQAATSGTNISLEIAWYNGASYLSSSTATAVAANGRRSVTGTAPASATVCKLYVYMTSASSGAAAINVDEAQFEQASAVTAYAGLPTLLRGDRFSVGGQRVMVMADVTANDAGGATVSFLPAHRAGAASAAAVTLVQPTTKYVPTQPFVPMPASGNVLPGFGMEFVEE